MGSVSCVGRLAGSCCFLDCGHEGGGGCLGREGKVWRLLEGGGRFETIRGLEWSSGTLEYEVDLISMLALLNQAVACLQLSDYTLPLPFLLLAKRNRRIQSTRGTPPGFQRI